MIAGNGSKALSINLNFKKSCINGPSPISRIVVSTIPPEETPSTLKSPQRPLCPPVLHMTTVPECPSPYGTTILRTGFSSIYFSSKIKAINSIRQPEKGAPDESEETPSENLARKQRPQNMVGLDVSQFVGQGPASAIEAGMSAVRRLCRTHVR